MRLVLLLALSLLSLMASGQKQFKEKAGFSVTGKHTNRYLEVEGEEFPIMVTVKGAEYVEGISAKTGNTYPIWIGKATEYSFEENPVRQTTSGKYFYLKLGKSGYPYARYLEE